MSHFRVAFEARRCGGAPWLVVEVVGGMSWQRSTAMSQFDDVVTGVMACTSGLQVVQHVVVC